VRLLATSADTKLINNSRCSITPGTSCHCRCRRLAAGARRAAAPLLPGGPPVPVREEAAARRRRGGGGEQCDQH